MKLSKLSILLIVFIFKLKSYNFESSDNDNDNDNDNDYDYTEEDYKNLTNSIFNNNYDENDDEQQICTVDTYMDQLSDKILPEDYEETKHLDYNRKIKHLNETIAIVKRLHQYSQNVSKKLEPIMKRVTSRMSEILVLIDLPPDCMVSLARIGQSVQERHQWAIQFLEAQPSITIKTNYYENIPIGKYDECLSVESPEEKDKPTIRGQYCTIGMPDILPDSTSYTLGEPLDLSIVTLINEQMNKSIDKSWPTSRKYFDETGKIHIKPEFIESYLNVYDFFKNVRQKYGFKPPMGFCLPSTCDPKDVEYAINKLFYPIIRVPLIINPDCDYVNKGIKLSTYQIIALITFSLCAILMFFSTIFELIHNRYYNSLKQTTVERIGKSFSIICNIKKIFDTSNANKKFSFLDGKRALMAFYVFVFHGYMLGFLPLHTKNMDISAPNLVIGKDRYFLLNNIHIVDSFFLIGGMTTCYFMLSKLEKSKGSFNYINYVVFRYLRLIPGLIGAVLMIYLMPLVGDGPLWKTITDGITIPCMDNWKPVLTMTVNYDMEMPNRFNCNVATWYTSADFQLYLLAPIVFLLIYHSPRIGIILNIIFIIFGVFIALMPKIVFNIPHLYEYWKSDHIFPMNDSMIHHYWGIEPRFICYMIGMFLGYLVRHKPKINFGGRIGDYCFWIISWSLTAYSFYWNKHVNIYNHNLTQSQIILWMIFAKICYLSGWFCLIYMCSTGRGGYVNKFLSWKGFKVMSNLSFEIYLLHLNVLLYRIAKTRDKVFYSDLYVWSTIPFDFILTILCSIILNILIIGPFANLLNIFLRPKPELELKDNNNNNINNKYDGIVVEKINSYNNETNNLYDINKEKIDK